MERDITKGSVIKNLILFSLPYLLSCFLQTFYGLADLFFIGQFNSSDTVTAVANGSQIMHMVTVIIVGLAMGSTVLIGHATGANDKSGASKIIGNTITFFMIFSVILTAVVLILINPILHVMSVPEEAVSQAHSYLTICFLGIPFITAYNIISCIFRGMGDSKSPLFFVAVACVINIILDYFLIGQVDMGARGAALATVISQTLSVIIGLCAIKKKKSGIKISIKDFAPNRQTISSMLKIGIPIAIQDGLIQVSFVIISMLANRRGVVMAASVGTVEKIIGFLFLIPSAMMSSVSALASLNIGADRKDRARAVLKYGILISVSVGLVFAIVCQFISEPILDIFSNDHEVIRLGAQYLRSYSFDCVFAAIHFCFSGFFCAREKSIVSFVHNIISIVVMRIPGAYLACKLFPESLFEMGLAAPLGSLISAIICLGVYLNYRRRDIF